MASTETWRWVAQDGTTSKMIAGTQADAEARAVRAYMTYDGIRAPVRRSMIGPVWAQLAVRGWRVERVSP